ncbi:uncharacterized protein [Labrus bergylta]|uniref:uncharacterized protein n=1 Tax=Labrus bergylta TaxID=56723 RepID=UPI0009B3FC31|nr:uncharacterized protein LOC109987277 isoform X2 [Labrus bergylta]
MARYKYRVKRSRDSGFPNKRDTPVKPALTKRYDCRKFLAIRHHEAIREEPELEVTNVPTVRPTNPALTSKAVCCNSVSGHPSNLKVPDHVALKYIATPVQENLAVTPDSITSSGLESSSTFSSGDDEEDYYSSAASSSSSSLPSPEIFRKESYVKELIFPVTEDLLGLRPYIKNSTLLDVSHAESIHMHQPPNLSNIIDVSLILAEKNSEINQPGGAEAKTKLHTDPFKSAQASKSKTPPKLTNRRPILYKKKVWFKSPIISETLEEKHILANKLTPHYTTEPVGTAFLTEKNKPDADTSSTGKSSFKEETEGLMVSLKRPPESSSKTAEFFDFGNDSEKDAFFQSMKERTIRLVSVPLFPLQAKPKKSYAK